MDDEVIFGQIDYIEEQVEFLIELCNSLKAENAEMKSKLESLELELNEKVDGQTCGKSISTTNKHSLIENCLF